MVGRTLSKPEALQTGGRPGGRKRCYPAHFVSKLSDSDSEAAETQVWLDFALDCGYLSQQDHDDLYAAYENIAGGLVKMMANSNAWCGPSQLREPSAPYAPHTPIPPHPHTPIL